MHLHARPHARPFFGLSLLVVILALVAACGGGGDEEVEAEEPTATAAPTATPEPSPTPEPTATPSPTPTPSPVSPLNGTPVDAPSTTRILGVKIDNHPNARPQSGIEQAELMVEIQVEGITRFLALFQDNESEFVGPIRSMRPTDFAVQNPFQGTFVNSGGQAWVAGVGNATDVAFFTEPAGTFRSSDRFAPHNLYGDTTAFRSLDTRGDYDQPLEPLWAFGDMPADAEAANQIVTIWDQGFNVTWDWNGTAYERSTEGAAHYYRDTEGVDQRITADTIVMLEADQYTAGQGARSVPATETTGSGVAWVFSGGTMTKGTWERATDADWFVLTGDDGSEMAVPAGDLWLIFPHTGRVTVQ